MDRAVSTRAATGAQEFKQQIYTQLKNAGVVSSLKSQLRTQLLDQLRKLAGPDAIKAAGTEQDQARTMWHSALNCMLTQYLETAGCHFTLSVFKSETDIPGQPVYSDEELCQLLRLDRHPTLLQRVQELLPSTGCLALALLQALSSAGGGPGTVDSGCQTSGRAQIEGLKGRLLQLEDIYMAKAAQKAASDPHYSLEQQMAAYKKECDDLMEVQLAARLARFKEVELATARQEAAAKYRQQLEADRVELECIHADRLARLAAREEEISEKLRRQQRDVESIAYSQRQRILAEEERIRGMKAEVGRQLEVQEQLLKALEAQLKEREKAVSAREVAAETKLAEAAELEAKLAAAARKEAQAALAEETAALRGERVAMESERSRLAELRVAVNTDLAVARAQEDRLRSLESARAEAEARSAAHAAGEEVLRLQLKSLQQEAAALQQELVRAGAAAGAAAAAAGGPQLYPATVVAVAGKPPLQLPQALRELGQWQRRAQQAELALDQAVVERDSAQSRADELTLDLNAARREIAAVRNQLARQQQDIVQLKLQLSQAHAAAAAGGGSRFGLGFGLGSRPGSRGGFGSPTRSTAGGSAATLAAATLAATAQGVTRHASSVQCTAGPGLYSSADARSPAGVRQQQQQAMPGGGMAAAAGADIWTGAAAGSGAQRALGFWSPQQQQQQQFQAADEALGSMGGAAGSLAGPAQESQARLAELSAADASMRAQLADFRQRNVAQRAAAARQLDDLRAAAGSSGGGAPVQHQQQQCRLSITSEFEDNDVEAELSEFDAQAGKELQQYQQRRAALEHALEPQYTQSYAQQQQQQHASPWQQPGYNQTAAAAAPAAVKLYYLSDALAAGGVAAKGYVQQHQQQVVAAPLAAQEQQQPQQHPQQSAAAPAQSDGDSSVTRPPSTCTEFSFVQMPSSDKDAAVVSTEEEEAVPAGGGTAVAAQSGTSLQRQQQQHGQEHAPADAHQLEAQGAATETHDAANQQQQVAQQQHDSVGSGGPSLSASSAPPPPATEQLRHAVGAATSGPVAEAGAAAAAYLSGTLGATPVMSAYISNAAAEAAQGMQSAAAAPEGSPQPQQAHDEGHLQPAEQVHGDQDPPSATSGKEFHSEELHAQEVQGEDVDVGDDFDAELSAISSAVAIEAAAASGLEGVRLSGSSLGNLSGSVPDRYASWAGADYSDEADDEAGYGENPTWPLQQQHGGSIDRQATQQAAQGAAVQQPQHPYGQPDSPSSPVWSGVTHALTGSGAYVAEDASSESGEGVGAGAARWQRELQSPGSSAGSVF